MDLKRLGTSRVDPQNFEVRLWKGILGAKLFPFFGDTTIFPIKLESNKNHEISPENVQHSQSGIIQYIKHYHHPTGQCIHFIRRDDCAWINALLHMDTYRWPLMHSIMNLSMSYEVRTTFKNNKHLILFGGSVWVLVLLCLKWPHRHSYSPPLSLILTPNLLLIRHTSCITHSLTWAFKSRAHNSQHFFPLSSPHPWVQLE